MTTKVQKWGNSLAVRIPRLIARETRLSPGARIDLKMQDGVIVITPLTRTRYALADLLKGITRNSLHEEVEFGDAVGREVW